MKVSLIQMAIREAEPEQNKKKVLELLEKAVHDVPDVIVLPEMWNTGYALKQLADIADVNGKETITDLGNFAKKHHVNLVAGSVATAKENHFFNTTYVFNREGQVIADYDKVHLFGLMAEDEYLQAGNKESVFELDDVKVASVICYDIRFPEWVRTLMSSGAKVLFVVAEWPKERVEQWEILLRARAVENQAFVVAVNRVGDGISDHFSGHSLVIDPLGKIVLQVPDNQEGIFTAELDLTEVEKIRGHIPVFADRKPDLYH
ncbi:carbon-nitrogen family hydrolase [Streptococcus gallolyticus]|uniref:carbon-nitrogen family hydrolase n=1 Tax=Streptococcus gallolyticus TaxID=315405 RepID=UPI002283CA4B|nr:carbon-nitrogen family hydrolase [Streptococcus gallolyticus]MCY7187719.1 carbon-nitrogen family hydrolase [Streptococcus gallolyticus subsp. gallolyticus]